MGKDVVGSVERERSHGEERVKKQQKSYLESYLVVLAIAIYMTTSRAADWARLLTEKAVVCPS